MNQMLCIYIMGGISFNHSEIGTYPYFADKVTEGYICFMCTHTASRW